MTQLPQFSATDKPAEIVAAAGEWLASEMGYGFRYLKSKREISRKSGDRTESIHMQTSPWSRTGQGTWVTPRIMVRDDRVRKWQAERRLLGLFATGGFIFSSMLTNLGLPAIELFGPLRGQPDAHVISLAELRDATLGEIASNLTILRGSPVTASTDLPSRWIVFPEPPFWWSIAYGELAAGKRFLARYFEAKPGGRSHFETGRRLAADSGPESIPVNNTLVALGWSAVSSGALGADEEI